MTFSDPAFLLLLAPLAAWIFLELKYPKREKIAVPHPHIRLLSSWVKKDPWEEKVFSVLKWASVVLILLALSRPQSVSKTAEPPKPVHDIVICLDTSLSMSALDFDPDNRLEAAKKAAEKFIEMRPFDRIGLVVFGGKAITQCPLTLDHESLKDLLKSVPVNATGADGTAIGNAISCASTRLSESEAKSKIIILLTDGRSNTGNIDPLTAAGAASDLGIKIYTIGAAVPGGGLVPVDDGQGGKRLMKITDDLDEGILQQIAALTHARYYRVTSAKRFKEIYNEIDKMEKTKIEISSFSEARDLYPVFLVCALAALFLNWFLQTTIWKTVP